MAFLVQELLYYKARQLLESVTIISKCERTDYASFGAAICKKKKKKKSFL